MLLEYLLLSFVLFQYVLSDSIVFTTQPVNQFGGQVFTVQPKVSILDINGRPRVDITSGNVKFRLKSRGDNVQLGPNAENLFPIVNGVSTATGLVLNPVGTGYTVEAIAIDQGLQGVSSAFNVTAGAAYQMQVMQQPGSAFGGEAFKIQPIIQVQDQGGNVVHKEGVVNVTLIHNGNSGTLTPLAAKNGKVVDGQVAFENLAIDVAGMEYQLNFTTDMILVGAMQVVSDAFNVKIGTANALQFMVQPGGGPAGVPFTQQPTLEVVDCGGNRVIEQGNVTLALKRNAYRGNIYPVDNLNVVLVKGVAAFSGLRINEIGNDYTVYVQHYRKLEERKGYVWTNITLESGVFHITIGTAARLAMRQNPTVSFHDGRPIALQPIVEVQDRGFNALSTITTGTVTATYPQSIGKVSTIIIDTSAAPAPTVTSVTAQISSPWVNPLRVGSYIDIEVSFSQQVFASGTPTLVLETGATDREATCSSAHLWQNKLIFRYVIQPSDVSADLSYVSTSSLLLNGGSIVDRNNNAATLTLPTLGSAGSLSNAIVVDGAPLQVQSATSTVLGNGVYASGEEVNIVITISANVYVYGIPQLEIELDGTNQFADYASGNGTALLTFIYTVQSGDASAGIDIINSIILNGGNIVAISMSPSQTIDLTMATAPNNLATTSSISIDTAAATVDATIGVSSSKADGAYTPGSVIDISVAFTHEVAVFGYPQLNLDTGVYNNAAYYFSGNESNSLVFRLVVQAGYSHASGAFYLNYDGDNAISLMGGSIKRQVYTGIASTDATLSLAATTANAKSLSDNKNIKLDGADTSVNSVAFVTASGTKTRGDVVDITVSFTEAVSVTGAPYLVLETGLVDRSAVYVSGSTSSALLFRYTVQLGDTSADLEYLSTSSLQLGDGTIKRYSEDPVLDAILTLPGALSISGSSIIVDPTTGFSSTALSLESSTIDGSYGVGQVLTLTVTLSDEVIVTGLPTLRLNTGSSANYVSGDGTTMLSFMYVVVSSDTNLSLNKADDTALECTGACSITNRNSALVDLSLTAISMSPASIVIDVAAPTIVSIQSLTAAPLINGNKFVIGDSIEVEIEMSSEVYVFPPPGTLSSHVPKIDLATGITNRTAIFYEYGANNKFLRFRYHVQANDMSSDLSYVKASSFQLNGATIMRASTNPTTNADMSLPFDPLPFGTTPGIVLAIDTSSVPAISSVTSSTPDGIYRAGDVIALLVTFTSEVTTLGTPKLQLDTFDSVGYATYASGSTTNVLQFNYLVLSNHSSQDLSYTDTNSLLLSEDDLIYQSSTALHVLANTTLPSLTSAGSLSVAHAIVINGVAPYIASILSQSADGIYGSGSILLDVTFSSAVTVDTTEGTPYIQLNGGFGNAIYTSGTGTAVLVFTYAIATGDSTIDLDYASTSAIELNGGKIFTLTTFGSATQEADISLNPPGTWMQGTMQSSVWNSSFVYNDLLLQGVGKPCKLYFETSISAVHSTSASMWSRPSAEYEVISENLLPGDQLGWSVDISQNSIIQGAPGVNTQRPEVQLITTTGSAAQLVHEEQILRTYCSHQNEVQKIVSWSDPGSTIGGSFQINQFARASTRKIQYDVIPDQLRIFIELDMGFERNQILVSRTKNTYCACENGYEWEITFIGIEGEIQPLSVTSYLTGTGSNIGDGTSTNSALTLVDSPVLSGNFALKYGTAVTQALNFDVSGDRMKTRIVSDLGIPINYVYRNGPDKQLGYSWSIQFTATNALYDIDQLVADTTALVGNDAQMNISTIIQGKSPISGNFRLKFRESNFDTETADIAIDASAATLRTAILTLPAINDVTVEERESNNYGGKTWAITFVSINVDTPYGVFEDSMGNLKPLLAIVSTSNGPLLLGSDAEVKISYSTATATNGLLEIGSSGDHSGAAFVFSKIEEAWVQDNGGKLIASDASPGDMFGFAVALSSGQALVGAPRSVDNGSREQQRLVCTATAGSFTLSFKGKTEAIAFDATHATLRLTVAELLRTSFLNIEIPSFVSVCDGTSIDMTLNVPKQASVNGDIDELVVDNSVLTGTAAVSEIVKGTYRLDGTGAMNRAAGAAYFFGYDGSVWSQVIKVVDENRVSGDEFGYSVAISGVYAVVGVPGKGNATGEINIFQYASGAWSLIQIVTSAPFESFEGDRFGHAVAISGTNIIVGAPGYQDGKGVVYLVSNQGGSFRAQQQVQPLELSLGDLFGSTVDVDATTVACGAPYHDELGSNTGAVYMYTISTSIFVLEQKVTNDHFGLDSRFGLDVAISGDVLVVGAHENYIGTLGPDKAVLSIRTNSSTTIGGYFRVGYDFSSEKGIPKKRYSRLLSHDATALAVRDAMERDLHTSKLYVSRTSVDATGGYTWSVTFREPNAYELQLFADSSQLSGNEAATTVVVVNSHPPMLRGNVFAYTRSGTTWTNQAYLQPRVYQPSSMMGSKVSIEGSLAVSGAWNLDTFISGINGGGAMVHDLGILNAAFSSSSYDTTEGAQATLTISRCPGDVCLVGTSSAQFLNFDTGDALSDGKSNSSLVHERLIAPQGVSALPIVPSYYTNSTYFPSAEDSKNYPRFAKGRTYLNGIVGTATSRAQFYGSEARTSKWLSGVFDFNGISDYVPVHRDLVFASGNLSLSISVDTNDDFVLEQPDENFNARISLPGVIPVFGGNLWSKVNVLDNGDGGIGVLDYSELIFPHDWSTITEFGTSVAIAEEIGVAVFGAPSAKIDSKQNSGAVYVYHRTSGIWTFQEKLQPSDGSLIDAYFGQAVAIDGSLETWRIVVGAPGKPAAYVFYFESPSWIQEATLTADGLSSSGQLFGSSKALAIEGPIIAVGSAEMECVFVYEKQLVGWGTPTVLRSSEYDYDQLNQILSIHKAHLGESIAISGAIVVAGAPYANYGNRGTSAVETTDTSSIDNQFFGKGAAYSWYKPKQVQTIALRGDHPLVSGTFMLQLTHNGITTTTSAISFDANELVVGLALESLSNIDRIHVQRTGSVQNFYAFHVIFPLESITMPLLVAIWNGYGCASCTAFSSTYTVAPNLQIEVSDSTSGVWEFDGKIEAPDGHFNDRFGNSIDIDGNSMIVGAHESAALATTSWDFEDGSLYGWELTGSAFNTQPTFGDNSYRRAYSYNHGDIRTGGEAAYHQGQYWVGTFEDRPGAGHTLDTNVCSFKGVCNTTDARYPGEHAAGSVQGDKPQGTMTSRQFIVKGNEMSFLVGGGCNPSTLYVELRIDGTSVHRATGDCSDSMRRETWHISDYVGKSAQVRVVDASNAKWGHINVDDFQFSWEVGQEETTDAGVAYTYRRRNDATYSTCKLNRNHLSCVWEFEARLAPSDKRSYSKFGESVSINEAEGIAIVGSPGHSVRPFEHDISNNEADDVSSSGAVYLFQRKNETIDWLGNITNKAVWGMEPHAKLESKFHRPYEHFGAALHLDGTTMVVGSPGSDHMVKRGGVGYILDASFHQFTFTSPQYVIIENSLHKHVKVIVQRAPRYHGTQYIGYSTSDGTATGMDKTRTDECLNLPITKRHGCHDYQQLSGYLAFNAADISKKIVIPIIDNTCRSKHSRYFYVKLHLPGAFPILGDGYTTIVRIDDDDLSLPYCDA